MGQLGKLKATHVDEYKVEHPIKLVKVYADIYVDNKIYSLMMKIFSEKTINRISMYLLGLFVV